MDSFSAKFSDRLTLYDPLEKPFPQEGESDQTVKHEQLIEKIHNMSAYRKPQKSEKLKDFKQVNMSYELELKLESMFNELEAEIQMVRTKHEVHVRNDGKLLRPLFSKDPQVLKMKKTYDFFMTHNFFS